MGSVFFPPDMAAVQSAQKKVFKAAVKNKHPQTSKTPKHQKKHYCILCRLHYFKNVNDLSNML